MIKDIGSYLIDMSDKLGKGAYGHVYVGTKKETNEKFAVKIISKQGIRGDDYWKATVKKETEHLYRMKSENIVGFQDFQESSNNYYLVTELCDRDLTKVIKPGFYIPQKKAIQMLRQICNGFHALLNEGIIHRDLKPANILIKGQTLKIADFGFSKQVQDISRGQMYSTVGTPLYSSWEVLKVQRYTSKCDIWSLGIIFYELLHGSRPWNPKTNQSYQLIQLIEAQNLIIHRQDLQKNTIDFLQRCLKLKEVDRIQWDQVFAHPIFDDQFVKRETTTMFQNKMKMIMNQLRLQASRKNSNPLQIMAALLFNQKNGEIEFKEFHTFLRNIHPDVRPEEAEYCFKATDTDNSGTISITELENMLLKHGIKLEEQFQVIPAFQKRLGEEETFKRINDEASKKIKSCFKKLLKIVAIKHVRLQQVFEQISSNKRCLTLEQFYTFIKTLCGSTTQISQEEILCGFQLIDKDGSNSIQFQEFNNYYTKVNGISSLQNIPPQRKPKQKIEQIQQNKATENIKQEKKIKHAQTNYQHDIHHLNATQILQLRKSDQAPTSLYQHTQNNNYYSDQPKPSTFNNSNNQIIDFPKSEKKQESPIYKNQHNLSGVNAVSLNINIPNQQQINATIPCNPSNTVPNDHNEKDSEGIKKPLGSFSQI